MIGKTCLNGCTLGGWWTDLQKSVRSGAVTAAQLLTLWQQSQITEDQYYELLKIRAEAEGKASGSGIDSKTALYIGAGVIALFALGFFATGRR